MATSTFIKIYFMHFTHSLPFCHFSIIVIVIKSQKAKKHNNNNSSSKTPNSHTYACCFLFFIFLFYFVHFITAVIVLALLLLLLRSLLPLLLFLFYSSNTIKYLQVLYELMPFIIGLFVVVGGSRLAAWTFRSVIWLPAFEFWISCSSSAAIFANKENTKYWLP